MKSSFCVTVTMVSTISAALTLSVLRKCSALALVCLLVSMPSALLHAAEAPQAPVIQADADPSVGELELPPTSKKPLKDSRLWLAPALASHASALIRAAQQALLHPDCNEVLSGGLNEYRTERAGTSFTILCMRDGRTTFNQVFFEADLMSSEEISSRGQVGAAELERLRQLMQNPSGQSAQPPSSQSTPAAQPDTGPAPVVF